MFVKKEINDFYGLMENSWSGGYGVLKQVEKKGREEELMALLEEVFPEYEEAPKDVDVNDFLWFELTEMEGWEDLFD